MSASGPLVPRRRIARELRRLREESGLRLDEAARELMISSSKLSRLENAQGSPQARDVRDLLKLYGKNDTELSEKLMRWVRAARRQRWWNDYPDSVVNFFDTHLEYESEASIARVYTIPFIPALLQTENYARCLYKSLETWRSEDEIDQLVEIRIRRQGVLNTRETQPPLQLIAVVHEMSLHQHVGLPAVLMNQLKFLLKATEDKKNVELRILPFTAPPPFTSTCMYAYFEFDDAFDRDLVHIETHAGFWHIETVEQVSRYRRHYDNLIARSLNSEESRAKIEAALEHM